MASVSVLIDVSSTGQGFDDAGDVALDVGRDCIERTPDPPYPPGALMSSLQQVGRAGPFVMACFRCSSLCRASARCC